MTINTTSTAHQYFSGAGVGDVAFARSISQLIITTTGTVGMSLDEGQNFMPITAGTYQFEFVWAKTLFFNGSGAWSGFGIAV